MGSTGDGMRQAVSIALDDAGMMEADDSIVGCRWTPEIMNII